MATLQQRITALAEAIGADSRSLRVLLNGKAIDNSALQTTAKGNLVDAINELYQILTGIQGNSGAKINDASNASTSETYSITKIRAILATAITALDANGDGKVNAADNADSVQWTGVQNKPTTFPPAPHDASLISSGTIDPARLPGLNANKSIVSIGGLADLTVAQQTSIAEGMLVTTTDGKRWTYTGQGDKLVAGSYIETADITPEWSVIANKPTTLAGYGITNAQALDSTLTALAGLTTAANQLVYSTGADAFAMATLTPFARSILDDADGAAVRVTIGALSTVEIGAPDTDFAAAFNAALV